MVFPTPMASVPPSFFIIPSFLVAPSSLFHDGTGASPTSGPGLGQLINPLTLYGLKRGVLYYSDPLE